ncbi:MAG: histone deacetylase [Planctomyces sp.]|nr:histone deacetylase [Planctomyces sp.]
MKLFTTDLFVLPLPDGHRFPMQRYRMLRDRLEASGRYRPEQFQIPPAASDEQLLRVHTADWVHRTTQGTLTPDELRRIGFPWSPEMVERCRRSTGATIAAARSAMADGLGVNLAGGTHHAFPERGAGYCVFNDVAVAIRAMQFEGLIRTACVVDGDVHQGDGTALIFEQDQSVATFSLHAAKAFPARKQRSTIDIELPPGTGDVEYLSAWNRGLTSLFEECHCPDPDIIFYLAGADPYIGDTLGGLAVSKNGLAERDRAIFSVCRTKSCPLVITMAGGYAHDITDIVEIQTRTILMATDMLTH